MRASAEEVWFTSDGVRLYGRLRMVDTERPTVVLLCGLGFHTFEYEPLAEQLAAEGVNTLSFDYRGHGRSWGTRGTWTIDELAADAHAAVHVAQERGLSRVTLFGNSLGAMVAIAAGARDGSVRSVVRGGPGFLNTEISGSAAPRGEDRARIEGAEEHEQKTAPEPLTGIQGQSGD